MHLDTGHKAPLMPGALVSDGTTAALMANSLPDRAPDSPMETVQPRGHYLGKKRETNLVQWLESYHRWK